MDKALIDIMALLGAQLNKGAQKAYLDLLPPAIKEEVAERTRGGGDGAKAAIVGGQRLLKEFAQDTALEDGSALEARGNEGAVGKGAERPMSASLVGALLGLVCLQAEPQKTAAFLGDLPAWIQGLLVHRIANGNMLNISRGLASAEADLVEELRALFTGTEEWGAKSAARILRGIGNQRILEQAVRATAALNEKVMEQVQNHLFVFEDLLLLSNPELQILMMQVDNDTLAQALLLSTEEVKKRLFQNVSVRRARLIGDEGDLYESATVEELQSAQGNVMNAVRTMYNSGKISTYFGLLQEDSRPQGGEDVEQRRIFVEADDEEEGEEEKVLEVEEEEEEEDVVTPVKKSYWGWLLGALVCIGVPLLIWQLGGPAGECSEESSRSSGANSSAGKEGGSRVVGRMSAKEQKDEEGTEVSSREQKLTQVAIKRKGPLALVDLDGVESQVEALEENSRIFQEKGAPEEKSKGLYLQVGRLRTTILDEDFYVRTPVVKISGKPGTVFSTRVVFDATTFIEVEKGTVEVESLVDQSEKFRLKGGQQGQFDPRGGGEINTIQKD